MTKTQMYSLIREILFFIFWGGRDLKAIIITSRKRNYDLRHPIKVDGEIIV